MGIRGEIFTTRFSSSNGRRTYFLNVKENRNGDVFLNIVESKPSNGSMGFERFQVLVFEEDFPQLMTAIHEVEKFMKKHHKDGKKGDESRSDRADKGHDDDEG